MYDWIIYPVWILGAIVPGILIAIIFYLEKERQMPKGYPTITEDERRQFRNFRDQHPELNYNQARYRFFKEIGKLERVYKYTPHNSRDKGFKPSDLGDVVTMKDPDAKYGWSVFENGKYKAIHTPPEASSTKQHLYVYVTVSGVAGRIMSLASVIWLTHGRSIPAGCVVDHIDENPLNNDLDNLQVLTIAENVAKARELKKSQKLS